MTKPIYKIDSYEIAAKEGKVYFLLGYKGETIGNISGSPENMIDLATEIIDAANEALIERNKQNEQIKN
jgi:hypothetical protein